MIVPLMHEIYAAFVIGGAWVTARIVWWLWERR